MSLTWKFQFVKEQQNQLFFECNGKEIILMVLEEDIFRVFMSSEHEPALKTTWAIAPEAEDIPFEGRDRFDLSPFSLPAYKKEIGQDQAIIETNQLKAVIQLEGFKISWYAKIDGEEILVANDRKTQSYNYNHRLGEGVYHYLERYKDERYYGLGEKSGTLNKTRKRYIMKTIDAMGYDAEFTDPLYKHIPFYITHNEETNLSYGLFYDNYSDSIFDLGAELDNYHGFYRYYHADKGDLDYYFILGPTIKNVVENYSKLTGKTLFPPKWSLGYSGSTMTYTDAPDAQEQLKKFVDSCLAYDIPCDSFQLSSGYTTIGNKRYVFNWDYDKIPDPEAMNQHFHENGLHVCANIKPCLLKDHPQYAELAKKGMFIQSEDPEEPEIVQFWDDDGSYLDFTNPETIQWWKDNVKEQLLTFGIDSTWNDNNEFEIWNKRAIANGFGKNISVDTIKPIQTLLMMKASFEAQKEYAPDLRPYLISRSGGPGMQRYVQTWSGDNLTEWKTLRFNIKMGLSLSLSGIYNFGHDVGGFSGLAPEPELLIRWIQNGIFHPRFTIHSWNEDQTVNVPWMYPEQIEIIRSFMKERVKWIPYFYHLLHRAHKEYKPILTPTFYYFEHDSNTFEENDDFMVGENLLVCSVVEKGAVQRSVYLPENDKGWYDMNSDQWYAGGQTIEVETPLEVIPLFAQAGSAFPIRDGEITFKNKSKDDRGIRLYPSLREEHIQERFYEDDGISMNYAKGEYSYLLVDMKAAKDRVDIHVSVEGQYQVPYQTVSIYLPKTEKRNVYVNGQSMNAEQPFRLQVERRGVQWK